MNTHIRQSESSQVDNLMIYLKLLERQEQDNPKNNRWKKIIKVRAEINEL
jgi:hypothetical protein